MSRRDWLLALALIVITFLVYAPAWNGQPIWDDEVHITTPELRSLNGLARIWTDPAATPQYYPVLGTIFWIEYALWHAWPLPYHLVNISLHVFAALLLLRIFRRLEVPGAWLAVAVFALHPVQVESVAWISELKNVLSAVFGFLAVLAYLRFDSERKVRWYLVALVWFVLGLMTKSVIAMLPLALLIALWWKRGRLEWRRDRPFVPFFLVGASAGLITAWIEQRFVNATGEPFGFSFVDRCLIAGHAFWFYLVKLFWPGNLMLIYPRWPVDASVPWQWVFPIATTLVLGAFWMLQRWTRAPFAALLSFAVLLFPVFGFLNVSYFQFSFVADHFEYLASVPIIVLVCGTLTPLASVGLKPLKTAGYACGFALLILLGTLTWRHSGLFKNSETIFRDVVRRNPDSFVAHNDLGGALMNRGATDEAIDHFRKALELKPGYQFANYNLAVALAQKSDFVEAIPRLRAVLQRDPNHAKAYYTLANALAKVGQPDEAIVFYARALKLTPDFPDAYCNLANVLLEKGDIENALFHYREALRLQPNNPGAHYNLAVALVRKGDSKAAITELEIALQLDPQYPDAGPLLHDLLAERSQP